MQFLILRPIVTDLRFLSDAHEYPESQVCPDLLLICLPSLPTTFQHLTSIPVGLSHNQVQYLGIKEDSKHLQWVPGHRNSGPYWFLAGLHIHYRWSKSPACVGTGTRTSTFCYKYFLCILLHYISCAFCLVYALRTVYTCMTHIYICMSPNLVCHLHLIAEADAVDSVDELYVSHSLSLLVPLIVPLPLLLPLPLPLIPALLC